MAELLQVSPEFILRPSLSGRVRAAAGRGVAGVSPEFILRPSLSAPDGSSTLAYSASRRPGRLTCRTARSACAKVAVHPTPPRIPPVAAPAGFPPVSVRSGRAGAHHSLTTTVKRLPAGAVMRSRRVPATRPSVVYMLECGGCVRALNAIKSCRYGPGRSG